jgi:hypothetical protein
MSNISSIGDSDESKAAFELAEEVITLRLAAGVTRGTKDCVFEFHVGHA